MQNNVQQLAAIAGAASATIMSECQSLAASTGQDPMILAQDVAAMVKKLVGRRTAETTAATDRRDGRSTVYEVRVQLIDRESIMADSHPDIDLNEPGDMAVTGLLNVPVLAHRMALGYHATYSPGATVVWPSDEELERRMRTVRVAITRGGGKGRWRIGYRVGDEDWMAFVLVATPGRSQQHVDA